MLGQDGHARDGYIFLNTTLECPAVFAVPYLEDAKLFYNDRNKVSLRITQYSFYSATRAHTPLTCSYSCQSYRGLPRMRPRAT